MTPTELKTAFNADPAGMADTYVAEINGIDKYHQHYISDATHQIDDEHSISDYEESGYWQQLDDDTWAYTFYVGDPNVEWHVWEEKVPGYNGNAINNSPIIIANGNEIAEVVNESDDTAHEFGSIKLSKKVTGPWNPATNSFSELLHEDKAMFAFHITLMDDKGRKLSGNEMFGDLAFKDGEANVFLMDNEELIITGIPAGYKYKIEEEPIRSYVSDPENETGTVIKDETANVHYSNHTSKFLGVTEEPVDIYLTKKCTGNFETVTDKFAFKVRFEGLASNEEYTISNGDKFTASNTGSATVDILLGKDETVSFRNIPVGAEYTITENAGEYISSYTIEDFSDNDSITQTSGGNTKENQSLSTALEVADSEEDIHVTFTNEMNKTEDIVLLKETRYPNGFNESLKISEFEITGSFDGLEPNSAIQTSVGRLIADNDGHLENTFVVSPGEPVTISGLPVGSTYQFTEGKYELYTSSYEITDENDLGKISNASFANDKYNKECATKVETVNDGENITVKFINEVKAEPNFELVKEVLYNSADTNEQYRNTNDEITYVITVTNNGTLAGTQTIVDPISIDVEYIEGSANNGGVLTSEPITLNGQTTSCERVEWKDVTLQPGQSIQLQFRVKVLKQGAKAVTP